MKEHTEDCKNECGVGHCICPKDIEKAQERIRKEIIEPCAEVALKDITKGPSPKEEARLAFVGALYAKAETSHLKRVEALIILQATLAEMLVPAIEGLKLEARAIEPFSIPRRNADLMIEIAEELRTEALKVVDHAMSETRLIIAPRMPR